MDKKTSKFPLSTIAGAHRESVYYSAAITSEGARGLLRRVAKPRFVAGVVFSLGRSFLSVKSGLETISSNRL